MSLCWLAAWPRPEAKGSRPMRAGPNTTPARISPTTLGWRNLTKSHPSNWAVATRANNRKNIVVRSAFDILSASPAAWMPSPQERWLESLCCGGLLGTGAQYVREQIGLPLNPL